MTIPSSLDKTISPYVRISVIFFITLEQARSARCATLRAVLALRR
jgi:hypothetical protein